MNGKKIGDIDVTMGNNNVVGQIGHQVHHHHGMRPFGLYDEIIEFIFDQLKGREHIPVTVWPYDASARPAVLQLEKLLTDRGFSTRSPRLPEGTQELFPKPATAFDISGNHEITKIAVAPSSWRG